MFHAIWEFTQSGHQIVSQSADCVCSKMWISHMHSLHYRPRGHLSSYFSVHSIVVAWDPGIVLPVMVQLQVAQEEERHKSLRISVQGNTMERVVLAACVQLKNFTEMVRVIQCAVIWRLYPHHKLFV